MVHLSGLKQNQKFQFNFEVFKVSGKSYCKWIECQLTLNLCNNWSISGLLLAMPSFIKASLVDVLFFLDRLLIVRYNQSSKMSLSLSPSQFVHLIKWSVLFSLIQSPSIQATVMTLYKNLASTNIRHKEQLLHRIIALPWNDIKCL